MRYYTSTIIYIILGLFTNSAAIAQITLGNTSKPAEGALLQLKENDNKGANATKGLLLPRVELTSSSELYPMFEAGYPGYSDEEIKELKKAHTGTTIYVPTQFGNNQCPGLYVWLGDKWSLMNKMEGAEYLQTDPDGEGNTYHYKRYKTSKYDLYWFTENVRSLTLNGAGKAPLPNSSISGHGAVAYLNLGIKNKSPEGTILVKRREDLDNHQIQVAGYNLPKGMHAYIVNEEVVQLPLNDFATKFGFMYTFSQRKSVCPDGWKLPNHQQWDDLILHLKSLVGGDADKIGQVMKNDNSQYIRLDETGEGHKWSGPNPCEPDSPNSYFNALPTGWGPGSSPSYSQEFGQSTAWWADELTNHPAVRYRFDITDTEKPDALSKSIVALETNRYSIRCVKEVVEK